MQQQAPTNTRFLLLQFCFIILTSAIFIGCEPQYSVQTLSPEQVKLQVAYDLAKACRKQKDQLFASGTLDQDEIQKVVQFCVVAAAPLKGKEYYQQEPWKWSRHAEEAHNTCSHWANQYQQKSAKQEPLTTYFLFTFLYECDIARTYY